MSDIRKRKIPSKKNHSLIDPFIEAIGEAVVWVMLRDVPFLHGELRKKTEKEDKFHQSLAKVRNSKKPRNLRKDEVRHIQTEQGKFRSEFLLRKLPYDELLSELVESKANLSILEQKFEILMQHIESQVFAALLAQGLDDTDDFLVELRNAATKGNLTATVAMFTAKAIKKESAKETASKGGKGRAAKIELCEKETIRLYLAGKWKSAPEASQTITPQILEFSKKVGASLAPTTTKPLEWIRKYRKSSLN